jgi:hypothetical protein
MADSDKRKAAHPKGSEADQEQYARFTNAASELGCEENPERMDEVVRRAAKLPRPRQLPSKPPNARVPRSD